ncbi:MAG: RluA family pseudouridine synthase [Polyangiaceae bacterium]
MVSAFRVPPEYAGMRLDRFIHQELKRTSRTRAQLIVRVSAFDAEGRPKRPSDRVRAHDHVFLWRAPWDEEQPEEELAVLFEDAHLLAVDKPPNVPVHPSARYYRSTVVKLLEAARPGETHYLAHRLDKETSGVLLLTKTAEADRAVKRIFAGGSADPAVKPPKIRKRKAERLAAAVAAGALPPPPRPTRTDEVEKVYLAIARGAITEERFEVDAPLEEDPSPLRVKMRVARPGEGLVARTRFEVIERRAHPSDPVRAYTLVRCTLETGRQHQIRVHLASIGHPIVGDKLYGGDDRLFARGADGELTAEDHEILELPRQALHAHLLGMRHPIELDRRVRIVSPLAADLQAFWDGLTHG